MPLGGYGIPGRIVHTPGHSQGSITVLLDSGDAFVGDLAMYGWPISRTPGMPLFAEDVEAVRGSWRKLIGLGACTFHPAHSRSFPASALTSVLG